MLFRFMNTGLWTGFGFCALFNIIGLALCVLYRLDFVSWQTLATFGNSMIVIYAITLVTAITLGAGSVIAPRIFLDDEIPTEA